MGVEHREVKVSDIAASTRNALVGGPFGSNLVSRDYVESGVPVIRGQNMGERWVSGEFAFVSEDKADSLSSNLARPGDIVFTQRGTLGQVSLVPPGPYDRYLVSQSQMKLTVNKELADPLFYYYVFSSPSQQEYIQQNTIQSGVPHTNLGTLRESPIPLPPLKIQRLAAEILGSLDDKIELNRQMNRTLEAMARAIFKAWFVDFEPVKAKAAGARSFHGIPERVFDQLPDCFTEAEQGLVPEGWHWMSIGDFVHVVGGATPSTKEETYWKDGIHPFCTPKDMSRLESPVLLDTQRLITDEGLKKISSGLLPSGTVLLSSRAPIGYLAISETPVSVNQGIIAMHCEKVSNLYILFWAEENMDLIKAHAGGSTFAEISKRNFRPLPIVRPPVEILLAFDSLVRPFYEQIVSNLRESAKLAEARDTLLPQLVSGNANL